MQRPGLPDNRAAVAIKSHRRLYRDLLWGWLANQPGFRVVGHVAEDDDLIELCRLRTPDLIVLDVAGDADPHLAVLSKIRTRYGRTTVVVVYDQLTPVAHAAACQAGVARLVPCSHGLGALLLVLRECVAAGQRNGGADPVARPTNELADYEREVVSLVATGHTVERIADLLSTSTHAIEHCKRRIYAKLRAVSQSHAIARAAALGMIDPLPPRPPSATPEPGPPLVVLRGPAGPAQEGVVVALLSLQLPFVVDESDQPGDPETWARWHAGPVFLLLVDPRPEDWETTDTVTVPVVWVSSGRAPRDRTRQALERGVVAMLPTERIEELLAPALTLAGAGCVTIGPQPAAELVGVLASRRDGTMDGLPHLTLRESQILRSIAAGDTVRQTARSLGITVKTVENTQARLFRKLGSRNRAATLARALELGLVDLTRAIPAPRRDGEVPVGDRPDPAA